MALSRLTKTSITGEDVNKMSREQLENYIKNAAKKSNMSLRSLEKTGYSTASRAYRYIKRHFFDEPDMMTTNKNGEKSFRTSVRKDESIQSLRHRAAVIANFRNAPSHTAKGVERQYKKAYDMWRRGVAEKRAATTASVEGRKITKKDIEREMKNLSSDSKTSATWFADQWGAFTEEQYKIAQRGSDTVAKLINEGYTADEIMEALERMKDFSVSESVDRYKETIENFIKGNTST